MEIVVNETTMTVTKDSYELEIARRAELGICPLDLVEAAIASCAATFLQTMWEKRRKHVTTKVSTDKGENTIQLTFQFVSNDLTLAEAAKYVALIDTYCPVWNMMSDEIKLVKQWRIIAKEEPLV